MSIHESGEDYLEIILILQNKGIKVRSVDIATEMNVSKASVSVAMKNLQKEGFIIKDDDHLISLTPKGLEHAEHVYEKHLLFSEILSRMGVDKDTAVRDACRMEHVVSDEGFNALKKYFMKHMNDLDN